MKRQKFHTHRCSSFKDIERVSLEFDLSLTPEQRLDSAQFLREQYYLIKNLKNVRIDKKTTVWGTFDENRKRL